MREDRRLEQSIENLLADPAHADHPLRQPLAELYTEFKDVLHQLERVTHISDRYQSATREAALSLSERYQKQMRQLTRLTRISDRYQSMMRELNKALKETSTKDALTGIGNRRMLMERLKAETARAERLNRPLTLAIADVDRFKSINDTYGHETGDKLLIEIAHAFESGVRDYDLCGRWGGEEFLIIMPELQEQDAIVVVERVRNAICELRLRNGDALIEVSASFGIAERHIGENLSETINRADTALFAAKRAGRNRYEVAAH